MDEMSKYQLVKKAIDKLDVYGLLEGGAPDDEFDSESKEISDRISESDSIIQIAEVITDVFNKAFDLHDKPSVYFSTAEEIRHLLTGESLDDINSIGTRENGSWIAIGYDIRHRYGYEIMLLLLDKFITEYDIKVEIITKSPIAGANHIAVWRKWLFNKPKPLSEIEALKEECGEVSVGGISKRLSDIQLYVTLTNQSSIIVFQVPKDQYSEEIKDKIDAAAHFIQIALASV
jgi:hypothetical protein